MSDLQTDRAGRRPSPATMPGFLASRSPRNKGLRYPADPPKVEEIIAVMRAAGDGAHGRRLRGLIVILWRAGLRVQEALALAEGDLDPATRLAARPPRQGRTPPRGRHGRLGLARAPALAGPPLLGLVGARASASYARSTPCLSAACRQQQEQQWRGASSDAALCCSYVKRLMVMAVFLGAVGARGGGARCGGRGGV